VPEVRWRDHRAAELDEVMLGPWYFVVTLPPLLSVGQQDPMRLEHADLGCAKGWHLGPRNSDLTVSIGYATEGVDDPHVHTLLQEVYLVARGNV
jgi:hypothetical protein